MFALEPDGYSSIFITGHGLLIGRKQAARACVWIVAFTLLAEPYSTDAEGSVCQPVPANGAVYPAKFLNHCVLLL
ncbi:hypothetical protein [Mangrovibacter sp. MFB070]|uniref:hypothetical protein n=1 Tax=Mangrovibacter sp. MFB070 TaxID=1224318 RepID=UPI0012696A5A|nr:hypothetical protein [Mangrovibacter sp. MFB070]